MQALPSVPERRIGFRQGTGTTSRTLLPRRKRPSCIERRMTHDPSLRGSHCFGRRWHFRSGYGWGASVASAIVVGDRGCGVCFRGVMVPAETRVASQGALFGRMGSAGALLIQVRGRGRTNLRRMARDSLLWRMASRCAHCACNARRICAARDRVRFASRLMWRRRRSRVRANAGRYGPGCGCRFMKRWKIGPAGDWAIG